ncbi:MAG: tRNA lysidine(34) synthetase TilS [Gammaproteobacteria bacterium]|nr:tRNA lysidine(34) synthetase TilS [Gammaproteobacteria bacterium]
MTAWRSIRNEIEEMDATFVLAISGGVDSMVLLDFFTRTDANFVVAHFNHNLQPINVEMQKHVIDYCIKNNIEHYVGQGVSIKLNSKLNHTSIEAEARKQRYDFLEAVAKSVSNGRQAVIVTGHHQDDQVETVMLNLFRGVGLQSVFMEKNNGRQYRPFLDIPKSELLECARKRGLAWIDDPTNAENDAERNWLRNEIIPQIMERRNISKTIPLSIEKYLKS